MILVLEETLKTQSRLQVECCAFSEVIKHLCQEVGCAKKQTSVSHSSTEAKAISLDAGLRMDGILTNDLWHLVIEVIHTSSNQINKTKISGVTGNPVAEHHTPHENQNPTKHVNLDLNNVDHVSSNDLDWVLCYKSLRTMKP